MKKAWAIARKEIAVYFRSPLAYVLLIVMIGVFNIFFYMIIDQGREASLKDMFLLMEFMFVFLVPILTMKLFAEENASGTIEFLMSAPVSSASIVAGKYLGSLIFYSLMIAFTFVYYAIIEHYGTPDRMASLGGYIGIWLEGAMFLAAGMMASSWCKSQTLAAISGYCLLFALYFSQSLVEYAGEGAKSVITYASTMGHAANFASGLIMVEDVVYYLSLIFLFLALTRLSIETRFWR